MSDEMQPDRKLDYFGLSPQKQGSGPLRFPRTRELFVALIKAENCGWTLYKALEAVLVHVKQWPLGNDWEGFDYLEPPREEDDAELKAVILQRREANPRHYGATIRFFDSYHRARETMWLAVVEAKDATDEAQTELDTAGASPLDLPTVNIRRALDRLRCAVRPPITVGPYPTVNTEDDLKALGETVGEVHKWVEELRSLSEQQAATPKQNTAGEFAPAAKPEVGSETTETEQQLESQIVTQSVSKPPPDYIPTSGIMRSDGSPVHSSTISTWRNKYPCDHWIHPSTGEIYHPRSWVEKRLQKHRPGRHPPKRPS